MINWLADNDYLNSMIIELGCGNAHLWYSLNLLYPDEATNILYVGIDYSTEAIDTAKHQLITGKCYFEHQTILQVADLLSNTLTLPVEANLGTTRVILDKGTFDAISLSEDIEAKSKYLNTVQNMLLDNTDSIFMIVSCNWTLDELVSEFAKSGLQFQTEIPRSNTFKFGGKTGSDVSIAIFRKVIV